MDLENILSKILANHNAGHYILTPEGIFQFSETVSEKGKYRKEAEYTAKRYAHFLGHSGLALLAYLGKNPQRFLKKHLGGVGSIRFHPNSRVVAAMVSPKNSSEKRYIVSNGYGKGLSEGIDALMEQHHLTRSETYEYVFTEETMHAAHPEWSESKVAEKMAQTYHHRASQTKDPKVKQRYNHLARVAQQRGKVHQAHESHGHHVKHNKTNNSYSNNNRSNNNSSSGKRAYSQNTCSQQQYKKAA